MSEGIELGYGPTPSCFRTAMPLVFQESLHIDLPTFFSAVHGEPHNRRPLSGTRGRYAIGDS